MKGATTGTDKFANIRSLPKNHTDEDTMVKNGENQTIKDAPVQIDTNGELVVQEGQTISLHIAREVGGVQSGRDFPFQVTREDKQRLALSGKSFYIVKVVNTDSVEYGAGWAFECDMDGFRFSFIMSDRDATREEYRVMQTATQQGARVGPVTLHQIEWKGGQPFYQIVPAELISDVDMLPW